MIDFNYRDLEQRIKALNREFGEKAIGTAATRAVNHTIGKARTQSRRVIRKTYNVGTTDINKAMGIKRARGLFGTANLNITRRGLPLSYFNAKEDREKAELTFSIYKGYRQRIRGAFITTIKNQGANRKDKRGVFVRGRYTNNRVEFRRKRVNLTGSDTPITELRTVSVVSMFEDPIVYKAATDVMARDMLNRFEHELRRL